MRSFSFLGDLFLRPRVFAASGAVRAQLIGLAVLSLVVTMLGAALRVSAIGGLFVHSWITGFGLANTFTFLPGASILVVFHILVIGGMIGIGSFFAPQRDLRTIVAIALWSAVFSPGFSQIVAAIALSSETANASQGTPMILQIPLASTQMLQAYRVARDAAIPMDAWSGVVTYFGLRYALKGEGVVSAVVAVLSSIVSFLLV